MSNRFQATKALIGKYLNRRLYTDVYPIGKIIGIKSKTIVIVQPVQASRNKTKMDMVAGGFTAFTRNNEDQKYDYFESGQPFEKKLSNGAFKSGISISDKPYKFHDYNF